MADVSLSDLKQRSCFSRWFGALTPGSMRGSIFALMSTAIGSGVLALPYGLYQSGVIVMTVFLIAGAYIAYWSMCVLMEASFRT